MAARGEPLPTRRELERIWALADQGDDAALNRLGEINARVGRLMNQRMRTLEKAGETGDAYKLIVEKSGGKRFSQAKTGDAGYLYMQADKALKAYHYKETTLTSINEVSRERTTSLLQTAQILDEGEMATIEQTKRMNAFFKSGYWKNNRRYFSSGGLEKVADVVANGGTEYEELMQAIRDYNYKMANPYEPLAPWIDFGENE